MSTSNPNPGVGGTAQDGGVSTAATVADGGPSQPVQDETYEPSASEGSSQSKTTGNVTVVGDYSGESEGAKPSNAAYGVGGTDNEGGVSTKATVADGGPDRPEADEDYKP